jgi:hypothetical protein
MKYTPSRGATRSSQARKSPQGIRFLQIGISSRDQYSQQFRRFTRVAARLLHGAPGVTTRILNFFVVCRKFSSGADGIRTHALRRAKAALSRLSYGPKLVWRNEFTAVGWRGLMEPECDDYAGITYCGRRVVGE